MIVAKSHYYNLFRNLHNISVDYDSEVYSDNQTLITNLKIGLSFYKIIKNSLVLQCKINHA